MGKEESRVQLIEWLSSGIYRCGFLGLCQVGGQGLDLGSTQGSLGVLLL